MRTALVTRNGNVLIREEGSYVVPKPTSALGDAGNIGPFIQGLIASKAIPAAPSYGTPVYMVMVDPSQTSCSLGGGTGGRNATGTVNGNPAGLILTTTNPSAFWPARTPLGGETTLTEHEVAEVIDGLRGGYQCCGDFCCEGWCGNAPSCANFSGIQCPGAPSQTFTGSSACGSVNGWLVQTLTHQGASTCGGSVTCDFKLGESCSNNAENIHSPCASGTSCCSGFECAKWTYSGHTDDPAADVCCKGSGASCTLSTDCCGAMNCDTTTHQCVCMPSGQSCESDADCCTGLTCQSAKCATPPPPKPDAGPDAAPPPKDGGADGGEPDGGVVPPESGGCACDVALSASTRGAGYSTLVLLFVMIVRKRAKSAGTR